MLEKNYKKVWCRHYVVSVDLSKSQNTEMAKTFEKPYLKKVLYELKYCGTFTLHLQLLGHGNPRHEAPGVPCLCWCFGALLAAYIELLKLLLYMWTVYNIILKPFHEQVSPFSSFSTPQWDHFLAHICYITIKNMLYSLLLLQTYTMSHLNMAYELQLWPRVLAVAQSTSCTLPL